MCLLQRERQAAQFGMDDDFYLPMSHRANDPLETAGLELATVDTVVPEWNKGFQMLRAMGWREGCGLGRNEDGALQGPWHLRHRCAFEPSLLVACRLRERVSALSAQASDVPPRASAALQAST